MLVKVFIKRRVKENKAMEAFKLLRKIRAKAMNQEGYVSGETMIDPDDPRKIIVISTWEGVDNWNSWKDNDERKAMNASFEELLEGPPEYEKYVYSKYYLKVSS